MNGRKQSLHDALRFASDKNNCAISYSSINLKDAGAIRYEYRLLGVDTQWNAPTTTRLAMFPALPPGAYTFQVRAFNADGMPSIRPAEFRFVIVPPFWKRWQFLTAMGVALLGMTAFAIRVRVRRLIAIERIRSRIATDLHDDIGSGLTHIAIFSDVVSRQISSLHASGDTDGAAGRAAIPSSDWATPPVN